MSLETLLLLANLGVADKRENVWYKTRLTRRSIFDYAYSWAVRASGPVDQWEGCLVDWGVWWRSPASTKSQLPIVLKIDFATVFSWHLLTWGTSVSIRKTPTYIIWSCWRVGFKPNGFKKEPSWYKAMAARNCPIPVTDGSSTILKNQCYFSSKCSLPVFHAKTAIPFF